MIKNKVVHPTFKDSRGSFTAIDSKFFNEDWDQFNVGLNKNNNPKILTILPKTQEVEEAKNSILHFEINDYKNGQKEVFNALPEWIRNRI